MNTRRNTRKSAALLLMQTMIVAANNRPDVEKVDLLTVGEDPHEQPIFMNANPRHDHNRGKRGGNGKGRQWWNK